MPVAQELLLCLCISDDVVQAMLCSRCLLVLTLFAYRLALRNAEVQTSSGNMLIDAVNWNNSVQAQVDCNSC